MYGKLKSTAFLAIVACLLWSSAFVGIKIGLEYTTPIAFAGIRFFIAGLLILPVTPNLKQQFIYLKADWKSVLLVSIFQTFILYTFFYLGLNLLTGALTAIIIGSQPLFAALVAHAMMNTDKINKQKLSSIVLGIVGVVAISFNKLTDFSTNKIALLGIVLLILANLASGMGNVFVSKAKSRTSISPYLLNSMQLMAGGLMLYLFSIPIEGFSISVKPVEYYLSLSWLSFLSAGAFTIWFILLQRPAVKVSDLNVWKFIIPVFGAILSWLILPGESPDLPSVIGMIIIAISLVMLSFSAKK